MMHIFGSPLKSYYQTIFLDVNDVKGLELSREDLEKIIEKKGTLCGATLSPAINVDGLNFDSVKMDKTVLALLINKGAGVTRADLSDQDLSEMDWTGADLSYTNCAGANFSRANLTNVNFTGANFTQTCLDFATVTNTNFTGVDLSATLLYDTKISSVIVSEADRAPYVSLYKNRLTFILIEKEDKEISNAPNDPFFELPNEVRICIKEQILFELTKNSLERGETSKDKGPQGIVCQGKLDRRQINKLDHKKATLSADTVEEYAKEVEAKLLVTESCGGFTNPQKILFHRTRSAMWQLISFDNQTLLYGKISFADNMHKKGLKEIYIMGGQGRPRLVPLMQDVCFYAVLPFVIAQYPEMAEHHVMEVYELVNSPKYNW